MSILRVVGFDPSMRNWGIAKGTYDPVTGEIQLTDLSVTQPVVLTGKQTRNNSRDLSTAHQLYGKAYEAAQGAQAIFVEVPVGSQSARAMASYGVCVGVLGALRAMGIPFFEVTPTEAKLAATGKKTASKADMIKAAIDCYPLAPWPTYKKNGEVLVSEALAEHMADATFAIHAGVQLPEFQRLVPLIRAA